MVVSVDDERKRTAQSDSVLALDSLSISNPVAHGETSLAFLRIATALNLT